MPQIRTRLLAIAVLAGLSGAGAVIAQSAAPTPAQQRELDAARAELDGAAKRFAELSHKYNAPRAPMRIEQRVMRKPVLGVLLAPDPEGGVRIAGVTPESGAATAGLKSGDRLTSIGGKSIDGVDADTRLDNARDLLRELDADKPVHVGYRRDGRDTAASVTPKLDERVFMFNDGDGSLSKFGEPMTIRRGADGTVDIEAARMEFDTEEFREDMNKTMSALSTQLPHIQTEILRLGDCKEGGQCRLPMLTEAFRWSGLNLASLDPQLGRYFGTDQGVLLLSTGDDLAGLQPGDVVQKIDGKPVASPRAAMAALRAKPADSSVRVDYLRDRKPATAQVKVPKADPFRIPAPPAPPAPAPPPPAPGAASVPAPPAPPAAPSAPGAPRMVEKRRYVMVDKAGKQQVWEGDANDTPPAWAQAMPKDAKQRQVRKIVTVDKDGKRTEQVFDESAPLPPGAKRVEKRRMVYVDGDGKTTVLEGDDIPPLPAPPAPPIPPSSSAAQPAPPAPPPPPVPDGD